MSKDKYASYQELKKNEKSGKDYVIRKQNRSSTFAVMAIHGGAIEPGTSEIANAIAGDEHSYYALEGRKKKGNRHLHIASEKFDEKGALKVAGSSQSVIAIHGCRGYSNKILLGGKYKYLKNRIACELIKAGFDICVKPKTTLSGTNHNNICNRGNSSQGVQIEIDLSVRKRMFEGLGTKGRKVKTKEFHDFVKAIRSVLKDNSTDSHLCDELSMQI